jgi:eukaryotic-like serine/threonine-protein kinase
LATLRGAGGFEKRLVVKQIRPELASDQSFIQRFVAEAKTTVELSHANIVPVYELGAEQGIYYIAMEFCAGVTLAELLASGTVTPNEGAYIGVEICRALDYAHRKASVVHRDVTPRNVMIDAEGMVRLIDFGIAAPASARSSSGPLFGSLGHMPPEQLRPGPLTPAADVFAVAVLLVEAWTGRAPFRRESLEASTRALGEPLPPLADSDPALGMLEPLIASALAHAPERRPQTAEELARPLREFLRQDDLGDIARRLGERVTERVRQLAPSPPGASSTPITGATAGSSAALAAHTPTFATAPGAATADRGTQTFATRDVAFEWTAKIDSAPPRPANGIAPETQEIESGVVAPSEPGTARIVTVATRHSRRRGAAVALGAIALSLLGLAHLWSRPSASRDVARNDRAATIAALPPAQSASGLDPASFFAVERGAARRVVEGGAVMGNAVAGGTAVGAGAGAASVAGAGAASVAGAGTASVAGTGTASGAGAGTASVAGAGAASVAGPAAGSTAAGSTAAGSTAAGSMAAGVTDTVATDTGDGEPASAAMPPRAGTATPTPVAMATVTPRNRAKTPNGSEHAGHPERDDRARASSAPLAHIELTADPVAWVELDGVRVGRTPLRQLDLSPGRHRLSFVSQLLGEKLDTTVTVAPSAKLSVHADFTSASRGLRSVKAVRRRGSANDSHRARPRRADRRPHRVCRARGRPRGSPPVQPSARCWRPGCEIDAVVIGGRCALARVGPALRAAAARRSWRVARLRRRRCQRVVFRAARRGPGGCRHRESRGCAERSPLCVPCRGPPRRATTAVGARRSGGHPRGGRGGHPTCAR